MLVYIYERELGKPEKEKGVASKMYRIIRHCDNCHQDLLGKWVYYSKKGKLIAPWWEKEYLVDAYYIEEDEFVKYAKEYKYGKIKRTTKLSHSIGSHGMVNTEAYELIKTNNNTEVFFIYDDINSVLEFFHRNGIKSHERQAETQINEFENKCKDVEKLKFSEIEDVKNDPEKLKQFIKNTIQIETDIFC